MNSEEKPVILIRVDCNAEIASGHLMRCISVAVEARKEGFESVFLMSDSDSADILADYGFRLVDLHSDWRTLEKELPEMIRIVSSYPCAVLLVDTYRITRGYVDALSEYIKVAYLGSKPDNLGSLSLLVNYSSEIDARRYRELYPDTVLLLGTIYAPLREEFRDICRDVPDEVRHVLVTTGNTDNCHVVSSLLKRLVAGTCHEDVIFDIVVGRLFGDKDEIAGLAAGKDNIRLHHNVHAMSDLMKSSQLAVSANGTTIYELAACGVPTISFSSVEEQEKSGNSMHSLGVVDYCGAFFRDRDSCLERIMSKLDLYIDSKEERVRLQNSASLKIDGKGCSRIVRGIKKLLA